MDKKNQKISGSLQNWDPVRIIPIKEPFKRADSVMNIGLPENSMGPAGAASNSDNFFLYVKQCETFTDVDSTKQHGIHFNRSKEALVSKAKAQIILQIKKSRSTTLGQVRFRNVPIPITCCLKYLHIKIQYRLAILWWYFTFYNKRWNTTSQIRPINHSRK